MASKLCDSKVHASRLPLCEVCEQAPAHLTCKADAASLCLSCDRDIHSANPLAARHERLPITPFYESVDSPVDFLDDNRFFSNDADADVSTEEAEAASWLLPNPKADLNHFSETEPVPYVDLDYDLKTDQKSDGVVPNGYKCYSSQSQMSHSVRTSSSMEVGVVPDENTMSEIYSSSIKMVAADREARVLRYREKRKNRKFQKTIRYASRKAYAETRPRIKGRFAKRNQLDDDPHTLPGYGC